jgi:hypothetical protein
MGIVFGYSKRDSSGGHAGFSNIAGIWRLVAPWQHPRANVLTPAGAADHSHQDGRAL